MDLPTTVLLYGHPSKDAPSVLRLTTLLILRDTVRSVFQVSLSFLMLVELILKSNPLLLIAPTLTHGALMAPGDHPVAVPVYAGKGIFINRPSVRRL